MRRTHHVPAGDRGEPLYVDPEQVCERRRLGLTQLREFRRDVRDGAMVLAQLRTRTDVLG
jgi:hypothetical protein